MQRLRECSPGNDPVKEHSRATQTHGIRHPCRFDTCSVNTDGENGKRNAFGEIGKLPLTTLRFEAQLTAGAGEVRYRQYDLLGIREVSKRSLLFLVSPCGKEPRRNTVGSSKTTANEDLVPPA